MEQASFRSPPSRDTKMAFGPPQSKVFSRLRNLIYSHSYPATISLLASALLLSMMSNTAAAASFGQLDGGLHDPLVFVLYRTQVGCAGPAGDIGCASADDLREAGTKSVSRPMSVADEAVKSAPDTLKAPALRRSPAEQRRTGTRKPVEPAPSAQCLATGTCTKPAQPDKNGRPRSDNSIPSQRAPTTSARGMEGAPFVDAARSRPGLVASTCAASKGLKNIPPALRQKLLVLSRSQEANDCTRAVAKLSPLREQLPDAYENAHQEDHLEEFTRAATDYIRHCLGSNLLLDQGALTSAEESFLRAHTGLVIRRPRTTPQDAQPICQAARLGNLVVTARHCLPTDSSFHTAGGYMPQIAFRFLDRPTMYDLVLRLFDSNTERSRDYAVLEIVGAPELSEEIAPLIGTMKLFADFYDVTANVYLQVMSRQGGNMALDFQRATLFEHSALCRPAYIGANGLFLHACQTEVGLSGTPFFQRRGGRLVFVGIHNGVTEALEEPSLAACAHGLPNYGVSVPPAALIAIQSR